MIKLSQFFTLLTLFVSFSTSAQIKKVSPIMRVGLITDIQYADAEIKGTRYYRASLNKLRACISDLNQQKVEFSLNLGDIIDRDQKDFDSVLNILKGLKNKIYTTTGNHDYKGITDNNALYAKLNMPAEYYAFKKKDWIFVMMNTNEVSTYANNTGTWKEQELKVITDSVLKATGKKAKNYNGGLSSKQLNWLDSSLNTAQKNKQKVLIFSHHPLALAPDVTALNDKQILDRISKYNSLKAVIAGHHHEGAFGYHGTIPLIVLQGMVETEHENAYGVLELSDKNIVIKGSGRTKSYTCQLDK
jgi:manganese-dependent ADP-ribose/CDP-alcohol diphosphatase